MVPLPSICQPKKRRTPGVSWLHCLSSGDRVCLDAECPTTCGRKRIVQFPLPFASLISGPSLFFHGAWPYRRGRRRSMSTPRKSTTISPALVFICQATLRALLTAASSGDAPYVQVLRARHANDAKWRTPLCSGTGACSRPFVCNAGWTLPVRVLGHLFYLACYH